MKKITTTINTARINVKAFDIATGKVVDNTIERKEYNERTLSALRKALETDTFKIIDCTLESVIETRYEMSLETFLEHAEKTDGLKIGNINRNISEYVLTVACYENGAMINKTFTVSEYNENEKDKALAQIRKEYETKDCKIVYIVKCDAKCGYYTMTPEQFKKYGMVSK